MLLLSLVERDGSVRRETFDQPEITIGRGADNDLVLPLGSVSTRHARLITKDGRYILVDLKTTNGTYVNGRKLTSPIVVRPDDTIHIGNFTLRFAELDAAIEEEPTLEVDPTELRLLADIAQRDETSRMVYADWLEEQGDEVRAEFVRLQQSIVDLDPEDPARRAAASRLAELAPAIDVAWRYKIARPRIEGCASGEQACARDWSALATTERPHVRQCGVCTQPVFYCTTFDQAHQHVRQRHRVAVDASVPRSRDDLRPPPMMPSNPPRPGSR